MRLDLLRISRLLPGQNVLELPDLQPLAAMSSQICKRLRQWLASREDDNSRVRKLFFKDRARHPFLISDLPVALGSSSGDIADAILPYRITTRRPSFAGSNSPRDDNSASAAAARVLRSATAPSSAPEHSTHRLPPVSTVSAVSSRLLIAWRFPSYWWVTWV